MRKRAGLTQAVIAERLGVSVPQVSRWEAGNDNVPSGRLPSLASAYEATIGEIFDDVHAAELGPRLYVKGDVAAGIWKETWEFEPDEWEAFTGRADVTAPLRERFGLRTVGNSMNEVYPEGTLLECVRYDGREIIPSGKRVIVLRTRVDGSVETTVKELVREDDGTEWLVPRSRDPSFQAFRGDQPDSEDIVKVEILAIVVAATRLE